MANIGGSAASVGAAGLLGGPVGMGFMLAMQAAGLILDYSNTKSQMKMIQTGRDLEKAAIETNLEAVRLESSEASLNEMKQLRQNLGTQMAVQAARGTASGAGTAAVLSQTSVGAFNADERSRRMNLLAKESELRASNVLSGLHTLQSETQLGQAFTSRALNALPISSAFDQFKRTDLGKKWGFGLEPA